MNRLIVLLLLTVSFSSSHRIHMQMLHQKSVIKIMHYLPAKRRCCYRVHLGNGSCCQLKLDLSGSSQFRSIAAVRPKLEVDN
uniref:Putative secreted peptide n=1 Tax=Anopheles braziliensis TaxID=58242 RepID=A0A2M3ZW69_9DIPT